MRSFSILLKQFQCSRNSILSICDLYQVIRVLLDPCHPTKGPIKLPPSVCLSFHDVNCQKTAHLFFLIFCMEFKINKCRKVTEPDLSNHINLINQILLIYYGSPKIISVPCFVQFTFFPFQILCNEMGRRQACSRKGS